MTVRSVEKIHLDETNFQEMETLSSQSIEEETSQPGAALHQVFSKDVLSEFSKSLPSQVIESERLTPSLWSKIMSWWREPEKTSTLRTSLSESDETLTVAKTEFIHPVPGLEAPDHIPADLEAAKTPFAPFAHARNRLTSQEIREGLSLLSERSIESILFIIFKAQIQLEKENACVAETTFSKYLDFQKLQQKILLEVKEVLDHDKEIAQRFKTTEAIAFYLAGIAAAVVSMGIVGPFWSFFSTAMSAGLVGLTLGTKAYFKKFMNDHKAEHELFTHRDRYYSDRTDNARQYLTEAAKADNAIKETWVRLLKRNDKMRQLVLKK
jgi:hypothetical protein